MRYNLAALSRRSSGPQVAPHRVSQREGHTVDVALDISSGLRIIP